MYIWTHPNFLSILRIVLILPIIWLFLEERFFLAALCAGIAFFTDYLDGFFARRWNLASSFGSILDPVADKLISMACLGLFAFLEQLDGLYFLSSSIRDVAQLLAIPVLLGYKKISFKVRSSLIAKSATAIKFCILSILMLSNVVSVNANTPINILMPISFAFEVYILFTYLARFHAIYAGKHDTFE